MASSVTIPLCPNCHTVMLPRLDARTHDRPAVSWFECSCGHTSPKVRFVPAPQHSAFTSDPHRREAVTC